MSDTTASLQRKIRSAKDLQSVVRTMKAMAASCVGQYESAVRSLDEYFRTVQLGLVVCIPANTSTVPNIVAKHETGATGVIVIGSDQGLVGQFNDVLAAFVSTTLERLPGKKIIWAVGERILSRLAETQPGQLGRFTLPNSIHAITPLVGQILIEMETHREQGAISQVYLFHNRPTFGVIYAPVCQRLLPLDDAWQRDIASIPWPTKNLPEIVNAPDQTFLAVVREYLFVSLFRACAESLTSENASRLAAMQRAEKNIDELLEDLRRTYHHLRQSSIDEELFDVTSGFEGLCSEGSRSKRSRS